MQFVDIVGSGAWGTTLAMLIAKNKDANVRILARREDVACSIRHDHRNDDHLLGIRLPKKVTAATLDSASLEKTTHLILVIPAQHLRTILIHPIFRGLGRSTLIMHAIKGIEHCSPRGKHSGSRMSEVIEQELKRKPSVLSGPNLAREIAGDYHARSVVASQDSEDAKAWQKLLTIPERFEIETSSDVTGVEIAGALKNIVAIGVGINDGVNVRKGLKESFNEKAEIALKALDEIIEYGAANGAERNTFYGFAGIGDIMATCFSKESRNLVLGKSIGKGNPLKIALEEMKKKNCGEPEGLGTVRVVYELSKRLGVSMPLTNACHNVLFRKRNPEREIKAFLKN